MNLLEFFFKKKYNSEENISMGFFNDSIPAKETIVSDAPILTKTILEHWLYLWEASYNFKSKNNLFVDSVDRNFMKILNILLSAMDLVGSDVVTIDIVNHVKTVFPQGRYLFDQMITNKYFSDTIKQSN